MSGLFPITIEEQIAELKEELAIRANVYPRLVAQKRMLQTRADLRTERMRAALATLEKVQALENSLTEGLRDD